MTDHIGSVRDLVSYDADDDRITLEAHIKYNAFGEIISETDATGAAVTTDHIFGFTARERDNESDLNYYRNRYYDPTTGRFLTADPIEDDFENSYRYVNNDPVNNVDPSGLETHTITTENGNVFWNINPWFGKTRKIQIGYQEKFNNRDYVRFSNTFTNGVGKKRLLLAHLRNAAKNIHDRYSNDFTEQSDMDMYQRLMGAIKHYGKHYTYKVTKRELLKNYRMMFPNDDVLRFYYNDENPGLLIGDTYWDNFTITGVNNDRIMIDKDLGPHDAVMALRGGLLRSINYNGDLWRKMATSGNVANLIMIHEQRLKEMARIVMNGFEAYMISMALINEGADLVLTANEVANGNYDAIIAALPFISVGMVKGSRVLLRDGNTGKIVALANGGESVVHKASAKGNAFQRQLRAALKNPGTAKFLNSQKGVLGELRTAITMQRAGFTELPARLPSNHGFDGVWTKMGKDGNLQIVITESKYNAKGKLKLGNTKWKGKQMSDQWVRATIDEMINSNNPAVVQTGRFLDDNFDLIIKKAGVTDAKGIQRFYTLD